MRSRVSLLGHRRAPPSPPCVTSPSIAARLAVACKACRHAPLRNRRVAHRYIHTHASPLGALLLYIYHVNASAMINLFITAPRNIYIYIFCFVVLRRQHLLTDTPTPPPASSVIVMKGLLDPDGVGVVAGAVEGGGAGGAHASPREWILIVNRVEGGIVRFLAGGVDLMEPGGGNQKKKKIEAGGLLLSPRLLVSSRLRWRLRGACFGK